MDEGVGWEPEGGSSEPASAPGIETVLQLLREMNLKLDAVLSGMPTQKCDLPPTGWSCNRPKGHTGRCATTRD